MNMPSAITSFVVTSVVCLWTAGCGLGANSKGWSTDGRCGSAALTLTADRPTVAEVAGSAGWKLPTAVALHDAASACGVVALPNAPASVAVSYSANGRVSAVEVKSEIFGGDEVAACIARSLDAAGAGTDSGGGSVTVALAPLVVAD